MRENLVGYLLGALDAAEHAKIKHALEESPSLRQEADRLQECLRPLQAEKPRHAEGKGFAESKGHAEGNGDGNAGPPPAGLAKKTCLYVEDESKRLGVLYPRPRLNPCLHSGYGGHHASRQVRLSHLMIMGGIVGALALLFFPAVAQSRFQSRVVACQDNLKNMGHALSAYSELHDDYFPAIPHEGNRAIAGIYAPLLFENHWITKASQFICPGSPRAASSEPFAVPTLLEIDQAEGGQLVCLQREMGGSYGYTLGYVKNNAVVPIRNLGRNHFAIMADRPSSHLASRESINHGQSGQNVLYESGAVRFVVDCQCDCQDPIYCSDRGVVEPGLHENDAVIGASSTHPTFLVGPETD